MSDAAILAKPKFTGWAYTGGRYSRPVMRGLDPRIHQKRAFFVKVTDCRVKPGNDDQRQLGLDEAVDGWPLIRPRE